MTLTKRRRRVLTAVAFADHALSFREIGRAAGLASTSTVSHHIHALIEDGLLAPRHYDSEGTNRLAAGVAVSRNGLIAEARPVMQLVFCEACEEWRPKVHTCCEADLATSLKWTPTTPKESR